MGDLIPETEEVISAAIFGRGLLPTESRILVGVSGGSDSVALLLALVQLRDDRRTGWRITVGHVSHGTAEWDRETLEFVAALANRLGLPFLHQGLLAGYQAQPLAGESVQMMERRFRHMFLSQMATAAGSSQIALAHTLDDQAETVLMRASSGHWLTGLSAIRDYRDIEHGVQIAHPLLGVRREQLRDYLRLRGETWRDDPHNQIVHMRRNRVRGTAMPALAEAIGHDPSESLALIASQAAELADWLQLEARRHLDGECVVAEAEVKVPTSLLGGLPPTVARELIREALIHLGMRHRDLTYKRVEALLAAASSGHDRKPWDLASTVRASVSDQHLNLRHTETQHD